MLTRRRVLTLLGAAAAGSAVAACGDRGSGTTLQRMRRAGLARVGIAGERPFGYSDADGRVTGESPEIARLVLRGMGIEGIEAVQVSFGELIAGLEAGHVDLITAGMTITPDRCARVAFSRPDFLAPPAFLVPRGNPHRLASFADVRRAGLRLGVLAGSAEIGYARAADIDDVALVTYDGQSALFRAVDAGRVPVGALTRISLLDELRRNPGSDLAVTPEVSPLVDGVPVVAAGAFAFRPGDADLLAAFDAGLAALQASGEWLRVAAPFGFAASNLPPPDLTTARLCSTRTG